MVYPLMTQTLPTIVGMGVVSETTKRLLPGRSGSIHHKRAGQKKATGGNMAKAKVHRAKPRKSSKTARKTTTPRRRVIKTNRVKLDRIPTVL